MYPSLRLFLTAVLAAVVSIPVVAQGRGGRGGGPQTSQQSAPFEITGTWISVVTEDWMFRMVTPPAGQFLGVPLNGAARQVANAWDPAADEAAGLACKGYGAGAIMRRPGRLRVSWSDPETLVIETEAGEQTRTFHFGEGVDAESPVDLMRVSASAPVDAMGGGRNWQGNSSAVWDMQNTDGGARRGTLKVVTTGAEPGYLRKNGVPYSADAIITEYFDSYTAASGDT